MSHTETHRDIVCSTHTQTNTSHVAVIIVNYKTGDMACRVLDSLATERAYLPNLSVVIVDNQSPDSSFEDIQQHIAQQNYDAWASAVLAEKNGGYAYGNNVGFDHIHSTQDSTPDYYWLLNPDTYLRNKAGLALVEFLSEEPLAICGSRLEDPDETPQISAFNFPGAMSEILSGFGLGILDKMFSGYRVTRDISEINERADWVAGASLMIPRKIFETIGPMDDEYFLYFEEVDYCLQIQRAGFGCWYVPQSRVVHEVGAATGISDVRKAQPRRPTYWFDSRRRYFAKNFGYLRLLIADIGWALGYSLWSLRKLITNSDDLARQPPKLLKDFMRNSILNPFR